MKKIICLLMFLVLILSLQTWTQETPKAAPAEPAQKAEAKSSDSSRDDIVTKTYFLNHINPRKAAEALREYLFDQSLSEEKKMLTVTINKKNLATFEQILKKMDVQPRTIQFRIFTVIAASTGAGETIQNRDLAAVLNELQRLMNFKSFKIDSTSLINVLEGADYTRISLSDDLQLTLENITIQGDANGKQIINIERLDLDVVKKNLIRTQTSVKENGYLVCGVSKLGPNGDSLILVINAEIK